MRLFLVSFFLFISSVCLAQVKKVYFFKDDGRQVFENDSADYIRSVSEPDSGSTLYNVVELYANGKKKLVGKSKVIEYNSFDGITISFFKNGKRKTVKTYVDGMPSGNSDEYYSNGKLYTHKELSTKEVIQPGLSRPRKITVEKILEAYDSLGTVKVNDGKGMYSIYNDDFTEVKEQGPIVNGNKNGEWIGNDPKLNARFEEIYKDGDLISGKAFANGVNTTYTVRAVLPKYPGDDKAIYSFLAKNIRYPSYDREHNIQGRVVITFVVEKDGKINDIKVVRSPSEGLSIESLRVIKKLSSNWIPGLMYGLPAKMGFSLPINYTLAN